MELEVGDEVLEGILKVFSECLVDVGCESIVVSAQHSLQVRVPELKISVQVSEIHQVVGRVPVVDELEVYEDEVLRRSLRRTSFSTHTCFLLVAIIEEYIVRPEIPVAEGEDLARRLAHVLAKHAHGHVVEEAATFAAKIIQWSLQMHP